MNFNSGYGQKVEGDTLASIWEDEKLSDSVRFEAINSFYVNNTFAQPDHVINLTNYHYNLAKENKDKYQMSLALNEKAYAYNIKGDYKTSMRLLERSVALLRQIDEPIRLATVYSNLGSLYGHQRKYQKAANCFNETLILFRAKGVKSGEARMLSNLGTIYLILESHDLALDHFNQAKTIYEETGSQDKTGSILMHIGSLNLDLGHYNKALKNAKKALVVLKKNNDQFSMADCYFLFARSYQELKQTDKAFEYVEKSLVIDFEINNPSRIIERLTFKAELAFESDIKSATQSAEDVLKLVTNDTEHELKAKLYNLLYKCYKSQDQFVLSLEMHEKYVLYSDSLKMERNKFAIIENAIKSDFNKKLQQNEIKNEKKQSELETNHIKRTYTIVFFSILIIVIILLYSLRVVLKNRRKREELLNELETLKGIGNSTMVANSAIFELDRERIETSLDRKINETDWKVLNILVNDPVISNKDIAEQAFMSVDGIGSSLKRMYDYFEIKESKYKKISLLMDAIKLSNNVL